MTSLKSAFPVLALFGLFAACQPEEGYSLQVDPALQPHFDQFETEAALRGLTVDLAAAEIEGYLDDLEEGLSGQCQIFYDGPDRILIDRTYWNSLTDLRQEYVVFHELGHCYLGRPHLDDRNPDGSCVSIMQSGDAADCRSNYSEATREAYLDELFSF